MAYVYYLGGTGSTSGTLSPYFAQTLGASGGSGAIPPAARSMLQPDFSSVRLRFDDIPDQNAIDVCRQAHSGMGSIVQEAERIFGFSL